MKLVLWVGVFAVVIQVCSCATQQRFSDANANYTILWAGDKVRRIECRSEKFSDGFLMVNISRGRHYKKVLINDEKKQSWSRDLFIPGKHIIAGGENGDISSHEESRYIGSDYYSLQEWKFISNNIPIYKEVILKDKNGHLKRQEFFGPFGVALKEPK